MTDLFAKCPTCGNVWKVAKLPMEVRKVARLAKAARCSCGSDEKPLVASTDDILASAK